MSLPGDVPELATPSAAAADQADLSRCLEEAAQMVQNFAGAGAPAALAALIATTTDSPGPAAERALGLAKTVTLQTETLRGEVAQFLSTTQDA